MTERVPLGPVDAIPDDRCIAAADGRIVVVRVGAEVRAYRNRCLHQDAPLAGGWVRRGVLSCPLHFWRYDVATGRLRSGPGGGGDGGRGDGGACLDRFEVELVDGHAVALVPDEPAPMSLREQLLARAADYDRDTEYRRTIATDDPAPPA